MVRRRLVDIDLFRRWQREFGDAGDDGDGPSVVQLTTAGTEMAECPACGGEGPRGCPLCNGTGEILEQNAPGDGDG